MWLKSLVNVIILNVILALDVGDECTPSKDVSDGICSLITDCEVAVRLIRSQGHHYLTRCGFSGDMEIVCCPKATDKFGEQQNLISGADDTRRSLRVADRECQNIITSSFTPLRLNIIGGEIALRGEFPHMVAIGYPRDKGYSFDCGGALISNTYVLTAAHCIENLDRVEPTVVRVGVVDIRGSEWNDDTDFRISTITTHPNYLKREKYHDIALIRLEKPVKFNSYQGPACLYTSSEDPKTNLTITGWGTTNVTTNARSNLLLKASVIVVPLDRCAPSYTGWRKLPRGISNDQLCAGDPSGMNDTCQGDSGGPLQQSSSKDDVSRIVGVTSFGKGCGTPTPGIYTRVSRYLDWIERIVWPN